MGFMSRKKRSCNHNGVHREEKCGQQRKQLVAPTPQYRGHFCDAQKALKGGSPLRKIYFPILEYITSH